MEARKVAVITGASQGIGAGLVSAFRGIGYSVVANSRSIRASEHSEVVTVAGDISDSAVAEEVIATALDRFGRIDTLVNNAGIFIAKPFTEYTREDYDNVLQVNLGGFFHVTQKAIGQMVEQGNGHVVNVTTTLVEYANSSLPSALASLTKGGLSSVTKSLAVEFGGRGVRVNAVSPGIIGTPMHPEETRETLASLHPVGRMGTVEDVTRGVLYLEQAPFVTGEFLHVDGGQSAGH
ncbi:NAD(P)-dependent dehydrogenase (short-subunit alcohol dehydrogenase family) [Pseudarthrobacter sp. W1I19]|uniref:SDR family NAD(P)-dependent oxidoreductase n=1 Tax=Pseudarthrobacter sp. W1I19 TaxID=3042288 RepID=UPI00277E7622|nr:SDR family oxidoreductase [Pseudarthrobacter sp. W1I19]MDQ0921513.1 NAD(P)-dependent dehydrogenase (short-subunit alcohol dehydrogenase family) [Pseudarthrobacter sp. W1I19]